VRAKLNIEEQDKSWLGCLNTKRCPRSTQTSAKMYFVASQPAARGDWPTARICSVASVTVATNAAHLLPRQLDALRRQTRAIDEIVVVDNASTDGTAEMLAREYPEVTLLRLPENRGVGGGYAEGLAHAATDRRHHWIWLLDDDSVPPPEGIENLLVGMQHLDAGVGRTGILAPVCVDLKTSVEYPGMSWRNGCLLPATRDASQPVSFVDAVISSGSLVSREAVEAVGLPRVDFFMDFVDYEYCLRMRRHGFRIVVVRDCVLDHEIGEQTNFNILRHKVSWTDHAPWREYYIARNETYTLWHDYPTLVTRAFVVYRRVRHALGVLLFGKHKWTCVSMIFRGFRDGRLGRLGIRFRPTRKDNSVPPLVTSKETL
jgi:GT2 family glycosyltransferase